jgi:hypothetical protein
MIFDKLSRLIFEADQPGPPLDSFRTSDQIAHTESGNVFLIDPDGEINGIYTKWYAEAWCRDHKDWGYRAL